VVEAPVRYLATLLGGDSETTRRWFVLSGRRVGTARLTVACRAFLHGGAAMGHLFSIPSSLLGLRLSSKG
jgi:hypothetical protein